MVVDADAPVKLSPQMFGSAHGMEIYWGSSPRKILVLQMLLKGFSRISPHACWCEQQPAPRSSGRSYFIVPQAAKASAFLSLLPKLSCRHCHLGAGPCCRQVYAKASLRDPSLTLTTAHVHSLVAWPVLGFGACRLRCQPPNLGMLSSALDRSPSTYLREPETRGTSKAVTRLSEPVWMLNSTVENDLSQVQCLRPQRWVCWCGSGLEPTPWIRKEYGLGSQWGSIRVVLWLVWGYVGIVENKMEATIWDLGFVF